MQYTTLGRTNLSVSRMGLGCGGHSRLGLAVGKTEADAISVVHEALRLGINLIDTAESYGTEVAVGKALKASGINRSEVIISTKAGAHLNGYPCSPKSYSERIDACLARLDIDYIDIFHVHGVSESDYKYVVSDLVPVLEQYKQAGKIRFTGITEAFGPDPSHLMLSRAAMDPYWDVIMAGFNLLNQSARERVLSHTIAQNIGTLCMFAVRRALSRPEVLTDLMHDLSSRDLVNPKLFNSKDPLDFLVHNNAVEDIPDAAYRFCAHEPGLDVVLSGTSNVEHLRTNAKSINSTSLDPAVQARLKEIFAAVDCVSGN